MCWRMNAGGRVLANDLFGLMSFPVLMIFPGKGRSIPGGMIFPGVMPFMPG